MGLIHLVYWDNGSEYDNTWANAIAGVFSTSAKARSFAKKMNELLALHRSIDDEDLRKGIAQRISDLTGLTDFGYEGDSFLYSHTMPLDPEERKGKKK